VKVLGEEHPNTKACIKTLEAINERLNGEAPQEPGER
jgi:hypothetical protein